MGSKIDSIRPGGTFAGTLREHPLPDLLFAILRANLSGKLELNLHQEARNRAYFRDGVPIGVELPDSGHSIITLAIERGFVGSERGLEVQKLAEGRSHDIARMLVERGSINAVELDVLQAELARNQLLRLFDYDDLAFRFTEGAPIPPDCPLAILEPLPLVFRGLRAGRERGLTQRFLETHERTVFCLSATFPSGVDPFHWGAELADTVQRLEQNLSMASMIEAGVERESAIAILHAMSLAGMIDIKEPVERRADPPRTDPPKPIEEHKETREPVAKHPTNPPQKEPGGLQIHRRTEKPAPSADPKPKAAALVSPGPPTEVPKTKTGPTPVVTAPKGTPHEILFAEVREKLTPLRAQSYFQLLRISPSTDQAQIERAYRFLIRRLEEEGEDPGRRAVKDLITEAYVGLKDSARSKRYVELVEGEKKNPALSRERQSLEAEPKVERAIRAFGDGRTGEASFLLAWAAEQDPRRKDVGVLIRVLDYHCSGPVERSVEAKSLAADLTTQVQQRPSDIRLKLCYAYLYADTGDAKSAARLLKEVGDTDHPLKRRVQTRIR